MKDDVMTTLNFSKMNRQDVNAPGESAMIHRPKPKTAPASGPNAFSDVFMTFAPCPGESIMEMVRRAAFAVRRRSARIVSMTIFNGKAEFAAAQRNLSEIFGDISWPMTWLESEASPCDAPAGMELHAITDGTLPVRSLSLHHKVVGCTWEDAIAQYCVLGDLRDVAPCRSAPEQTRRVLEDMIDALAQAGMTFKHVYRTWFRNRDILAWYSDFNHVRTEFFNKLGVFDGLLPASTGISAGNPFGADLVAGLWALKPKHPDTRVCVVDSPLQDSACRYGSSFSRAVEVQRGDLRHLTISGTASIGPDGRTMHVGNIDAQVDQTMRVVRAILNSRHMDWPNVVRGLAYFRHSADIGAYSRWAAGQRATLPVIELNHTVCRDDLLYEIEVDARAV
jgi:enamine deaminase RidA (YjgF/YER057c/UK114 family)